jgi:hypothetical protein
LSSKYLKPDEICILSKGLNFFPTPSKFNEEQPSVDLDKFARSLRIKEYFLAKKRDFPVDGSSNWEDDNEISLPRFKKKKFKESKSSKNTHLESFIDLVKIDVQTAASTNIPTHNNLTPAEKGAIQVLKERDDIVIKPVDKGSVVVVMEKVNYLEEKNRQVTDERFYKKMDSEPTKEFSTRIIQELKFKTENSHIEKNIFDYLKPDKPKAGRFYLLPKTHKVNNPGRPIFQQLGTPQKIYPNSAISTFDFMYKRYPHI